MSRNLFSPPSPAAQIDPESWTWLKDAVEEEESADDCEQGEKEKAAVGESEGKFECFRAESCTRSVRASNVSKDGLCSPCGLFGHCQTGADLGRFGQGKKTKLLWLHRKFKFSLKNVPD